MRMDNLISLFDAVNFTAAVFGIVTGIVALLLSVMFFFSAKGSERKSEIAMTEIKISTELLNKLSMRMLDRVTKALIAPRPTEDKLIELFREVSNKKTNESTKENPTSADRDQWRIDNAIVAAFYAATTNLANQRILTIEAQSGSDITTHTLFAPLDTSKKELNGLIGIIDGATDRLEKSPYKDRYDAVISAKSNILSSKEFADTLNN